MTYIHETFQQVDAIDTTRLRSLAPPKPVARALATYDKTLEAYLAAVSEREAAEATLSQASANDAEALRTALQAGLPDPGPTSTQAERAAYVAQERMRLARQELDAASANVTATAAPVTAQLLSAAAAQELEQIQAFERAVDTAAAALRQAVDAGREVGRTYQIALDATGSHGPTLDRQAFQMEPEHHDLANLQRLAHHARARYQRVAAAVAEQGARTGGEAS